MRTSIFKQYITLLLLLTGVLYSCKKSFLELDPKGKLIAKNTNDYNLMLNNTYFDVSGADGQVILGDEVTSVQPYYNNMSTLRSKRYFEYSDDIYQANESGTEFSVLMSQLYVYNIIINEVMDAQGGTEEQKKTYLAEALTNRAWIYFMLINYYGKPYREATAATDPGFPIVTKADVNQAKFERASVKAVYDFIIGDLQAAIPFLPLSGGNRIRVCRSGAEAILGKVYLFMGRYQDGLTQMNSAFSHLPTAYPVGLYNYNSTLAIGGKWGYNPVSTPQSYIFGVTLVPENQEVLFAKQYLNSYTFYLNDLLLTARAAALYGVNDQRLKLYAKNYFGGAVIRAGAFRKVGFLAAQIGMTMPDMYLMMAEMKARTGDVSGARADLETFRKNRMPDADAGVDLTDQTEMVKFIIDERIREFALQGYRWFDMRRLSTDPIFEGATYTHQALSESGTVISSFPLKPERLTLRFPAKVIDANPGMPNNP